MICEKWAKAGEGEETFSARDDRKKRGHLDLGLSSRAGQSSKFFLGNSLGSTAGKSTFSMGFTVAVGRCYKDQCCFTKMKWGRVQIGPQMWWRRAHVIFYDLQYRQRTLEQWFGISGSKGFQPEHIMTKLLHHT